MQEYIAKELYARNWTLKKHGRRHDVYNGYGDTVIGLENVTLKQVYSYFRMQEGIWKFSEELANRLGL